MNPTPITPHAVREAALRVAAEAPDLTAWHARVGACPHKRWRAAIRAAGWPERVETVRVLHTDGRPGRCSATRAVEQEVLVVPEA